MIASQNLLSDLAHHRHAHVFRAMFKHPSQEQKRPACQVFNLFYILPPHHRYARILLSCVLGDCQAKTGFIIINLTAPPVDGNKFGVAEGGDEGR